ncbi:hypothetical protein LIER_17042 [Lithospermum erythrorhizon]|uniref:Uncharacterized protein n=1 Tax=Lithospermum erythrorhizon TaxID=34254 RepID=A0AAV3Q8W8_LITER
MDILDESGMNALVGDIGPHWPSIVRQDIVNPSSFIFHKVKLRGHMFNFSPALINKHYGRQNAGVTGSTLKLNDIIKTLTGAEDGLGEDAKPLTIIDKLMSGKRVVDVEVKGPGQSAAVLAGEAAALLIKAYEEEQKILEADIRLNKNRVAKLKAKIQSLQTTVPPAVNDHVDANNEAAPADVTEPVADPPTVNAPTSDVAEVLDETTQSHV